jgi:cysteine desulfurase
MRQLFLDANAHIPISDVSLKNINKYNNSLSGHGHPLSSSILGREAASTIEKSREKIAIMMGAKSSAQIFFTNSCTQACEWGIKILANINKDYNEKYGIEDILTISPFEHPAALQPVTNKTYSTLCEHYELFKVSSDGMVITEGFDNNINRPGKSVCIHMHNEIGTIQPIENLNATFLFSDISQSLGKIDVNVTELGMDIAVAGAHKFGGPGGVGILYLKDSSHWIEFGTGSRYSLDIPGTSNTLGIVTTVSALTHAKQTLSSRTKNMRSFRDILEPGLEDLGFEIICKNGKRSPNTSFVKVPEEVNSFTLIDELGKNGIHCGLGSACNSLYGDELQTMKALGLDPSPFKYIRISQWGEYKEEEAKHFLFKVGKLL